MPETGHARERDFLATLGVNPEVGLTAAEVLERRRRHGPNLLIAERRERFWERVLRPIRDPMALLLLGAGIVYILVDDLRNASVMFLALIPIVAVDYALEERAQRTLVKLKTSTAPRAVVLRAGRQKTVPAADLVPGDVVAVSEGDVLPADGVLIAGSDVRTDESSLTGEAFPVTKESWAVNEQSSQLYAGTALVSGRGTMVLTATGLGTSYGRIGALAGRAKPRPTPTQRAIEGLVWRLSLLAGIFLIVAVAASLARGSGWVNAVSAGVSLAIAIIPEEFALVFTLYLALGAWRLSRRNVLVRRMQGVETLGSVNVVFTDKTGTLTEGNMSVTGLCRCGRVYDGARVPYEVGRVVLEAAVLASEPRPYDPLEQSLLAFAPRVGVDLAELFARWRLVGEYPFESRRKYLSHIWRSRDGVLRLCAKGAIEGILDLAEISSTERRSALQGNRELAQGGMRVLAVAEKRLERFSGDRRVDEEKLHFLGLIGFTDPPRSGVRDSIAECQSAGIRVVMITGDHPLTAHNVAEDIGLRHNDEDTVTGETLERLRNDAQLEQLLRTAGIFARITPVQKHRLVRVLRESGAVVAMTGDGINDAPALREADIGVAMGRRGTEVAREAATMVLMDDNFRSIVAAVREGRRIFDNLQHVFGYLIAFHTPIILITLLVPLLGVPLLLWPVHLVWLELIVHPTSALVFEADPPAADLMRRPPRPLSTTFVSRVTLLRSVLAGMGIAVGALGLFLLALSEGVLANEARALSVTSLLVGQAVLVAMERSPQQPFWVIRLSGNKLMLPILAATLASLALFLYVPYLSGVMGLAPLSTGQAAFAFAVGLACTLPMELAKCLTVRRSRAK